MNQNLQTLSVESSDMNNPFKLTDEKLIARFQDGDINAYNELVKRYKDRLLNFVFRYFNNREQAEDVVQDTLIKLYTHASYYKNIAKFSTWIYTIAGNFAKTELRKKKTRKVTNNSQLGPEDRDYDPPSNDPNPQKLVESEFINTKIHEAIEKGEKIEFKPEEFEV